jgi:hypothetical protein
MLGNTAHLDSNRNLKHDRNQPIAPIYGLQGEWQG